MTEGAYKKYLLVVLLSIMASNYVDRHAFGLLLQTIKLDLALTDTQLGLLTGIAFALFYSVMGIPIARWADRGDRIVIITLTTALWSVAVALCGLATSFMHLLLIRVAVAIGEAGCVPPAHSLIADYFSRSERPKAVSIYSLGIPLSALIGFFLAGWLNQLFGWRMTFVLLGTPGVGLALLAWLTLKEPRRKGVVAMASRPSELSFVGVLAALWSKKTFRNILLGYSIGAFFSHGISQWAPAFFIRSFGLGTGELGLWMTIIWGAAPLAGIYLGGVLASRYAVNDESLQLRAIAVVYIVFGVLSTCSYLSSNAYLAFALLGFGALIVTMAMGPFFAMIQTLVPENMRAMSIALVFLFSNLIGLGLGPLAVGMLSDAYAPSAGDESLRYALVSLSPGFLLTAWYLWKGARTVAADL